MRTRLSASHSPVLRRLPLLLVLVLLPLLLLAWVQWQNEKRLPSGNDQLLSPASLAGQTLPLRFPPHSAPQRLDWDFVLPEQTPQPWSLLLQHRPGVQVLLNGQLIAQSLSAVRLALPDNRMVLGGEWLLVPLPPQLLATPGPQRLSIQLGHAGPSGARIGGLWVGPSQAVQALDSARQHWQLLRSGTAFAALVVACFLALVAGVRLKERLYGMSALLLALLALLLSPYVLPIQPLPSPYWRMLLDAADLLAKALQLAIVAQALGLRLPWRWLAPVILLTLGWDAWAAVHNQSWGDFSALWPWNALGVRALLLLTAPLMAWIVFARRGGARAAGLALMSGLSLACWSWVNAGALVWPGRWTVVDTNALAHAGWVLGLGALLAHHFVGSAQRERALRAELELELQRQKETLAAQYQALQRSERAQAAAGERERLLQDMHDGLGNQLLTLRLLVEAGEIDPETLGKALDACLLEMRLAVDALGDDDGDLPLLLASLRHRLKPGLRAAGLELDWQVQSLPPLPALEGRGALELMRWLQEVFSNVLRHAQAERMLVRAERADLDGRRGILLLLADNGVGMAVGASGGRGLRNLRERAARLGAHYVCRSPRREASPEGGGPGTEHALWWPLDGGGRRSEDNAGMSSSVPAFVHLRSHSEFAVVDGILRIDDLVKRAAKDEQVALAVTDLANLFGAVKFYKAARKKGIKPVIGADCWLEPEGQALPGTPAPPPARVLLLVQDRQGYLNLCELLSRAWLTNVVRNQACLKREWLSELGAGLICLSGYSLGPLAGANAEAQARLLAEAFPGRFYVELQRVQGPGSARNEKFLRSQVELAARLGLPVVATHPMQFLDADEYDAHEARVCVADGDTLDNPKRIKRFSPDQCFKSQAEMRARFADLPSAIANTLAIAERCSLELVLGKPQLPDFPTPLLTEGPNAGSPMPMADYFRQLSFEGLEVRLKHLYPDESKREAQRARYVERLEFELNTIIKMGFPGYFLIVADFIQWAKNNGCPVGPGRGSGAGSLVAYALLITDLDPLAYNLLFERFLNPERVSMPDFDIDFCQGNRDRVIDYVKDKYGRDAVSQIATFGTMAAKAALRDVGRVLGMSYGHVDSIAKLIPAPPGKTVTLAKPPEKPDDKIIYARIEAPELNEREADDEEVATLLGLATQVEGLVRNIGMHAGGVLIAPGKITDFCPLYQQPGSDSAVSQYDKDDVEAIGLVKFDFLGLATLTILELAKDYIVAAGHTNFAYENLPLDDAKTYKLFAAGKTEAVFQFESRGMQGMLKDAKPTRLEDLIALNAMFRPGPLENIPSFCKRKNGEEKIEYPHPLLGQVLNETYGIFVYQEQVMQAAQLMGDYSLGGADLLRRAMGKKKAEEMAAHRQMFRDGAAKQGIDPEKADEVFDLMEKFAGYGFNKSHAAAYSLLAYHTGFIKVHHTAAFFAANMTVESDNTDKLKILLADARAFGLDFQPPCVNRSVGKFVPLGPKLISYGLGAIKGTGQGAIEAIVAARQEGGPFKSLFDFCARVDKRSVNKRVAEALIKAGAFDAVGSKPSRERLVASLDLAFRHAEMLEANVNQGGLFDFDDAPASEPDLLDAPDWGVRERLSLEKTAIGFYLSGHLFDEHAGEVRRLASTPLGEQGDTRREAVLLAGIVGDLRVINGARGRTCIFKLDDGSGSLEFSCSGDQYDGWKELLQEDALLFVQGTVSHDKFTDGLRGRLQTVFDLAGARARFARALLIELPRPTPAQVAALKDWVNRFPPQTVETEEGSVTRGLSIRWPLRLPGVQAECELGTPAWPSDESMAELRKLGLPAQLVYR